MRKNTSFFLEVLAKGVLLRKPAKAMKKPLANQKIAVW